MAEERINPIRLRFENEREYVLEFSAQTVSEAERAGVTIESITKMPMTMIPLFFFYAFKMHHPTISKKKTDEILRNDLGGLSEAIQERLVDLYLAPMGELVGDESPKNVNMTVEM